MVTAEEYFEQLVRPIRDSQIEALSADGTRRYCWAEIMFFARWWDDQPDMVRARARQLAREGRLEFVEGGWSQADELVVSLDERIQNLEAGHQWLLDNIATDAYAHADDTVTELRGLLALPYRARSRASIA